MQITKDMTLREIIQCPEFAPMQGKFLSSALGDQLKDKYDLTLVQLQEKTPTWYHADILLGLNRLYDVAQQGNQYVFELSNGVSLIHMPATVKKYDSFALLMAGGAYSVVCTMVETLPVAAKLNELGMDCFCLNYRTASNSDYVKGLMPKPLEDVATALHFIEQNEALFGVDAKNYIAGGFSAGGHLAAMWGTEHRGARSFCLPNPKLLLLGYPLISMETMVDPMSKIIAMGLLGAIHKKAKVLEYAADRHVDENYPPVFLVQAKNDDTVPIGQSYAMEEALRTAGVHHVMERPEVGGHGFGLGNATPAKGWPERALVMLEE